MHINPTITIAIPKINSHHDKGSKSTSNMPTPNPIKHMANVFLNILNPIWPPPLSYFII